MPATTVQENLTRITLWVSPSDELITAEPIAPPFQPIVEFFQIVPAASTKPSEIAKAGEHHIIINTDEVKTWEIAMELEDLGCRVEIFTPDTNLCDLIFRASLETIFILQQTAKPFKKWQRELAAPISLEDAMAVAKIWLSSNRSKVERNIALEALHSRSGVKFEWFRYIKDLEEEIHSTGGAASTDPRERLRLDIKALLKETDEINYQVLRSDIQSRYRLKDKSLEKIIRSVEQNTKVAEPQDMGLDELFNLPTNNLEYVVPGMLPVGETALLVASPKAGKSLLAYDVAFSVATGEDTFLGEKCKQGKVLIVQCDESVGTAKGRLLKRGFRHEDTDKVRFMHKFSITQLNVLEERLETFRPTLVIIDSLRRINAGRELSENSAEFADAVYQLKELCAQYNAACLLIHHSSKNSEAVGVDRVRGSSAIAGATWGIWQLDQIPKPDPNNKKKQIIDPKDLKRVLSITSRDTEGQRLMIELDPDQNHWLNHGEVGVNPEDLRERKSQSAQIIELLKSASPLGLEASEIMQQLGLGRGIYSVLNRLVGSREIGTRPSTTDRRRSVYFSLTFDNNPPPPTDTDPDVIEYPETNTTTDVQSSITVDHKSITFDHITSVVEECDQPSNVDGESITAYSITSSPLEGGEGVEESVDTVTVQPEIVPNPWDDSEPVEEEATTLVARSESATDAYTDADIADIAEILADETLCADLEALGLLRQCWNPQAMNKACKRLTVERHAQIKQWVIELNSQQFQVGDRVYVSTAPHSDAMAPYSIERIEGDSAKVECFANLIPLVELRKA
ncbi:MAG: AAA family ATPase [Microcoleus sp. SIO2G3]|nr:AAA family ATPase [Microcoleus sp. SIO2G3]